MKIKTSVAAVLFALSAGAAWAGDAAQSRDDLGGPGPESTGVQPSSAAPDDALAWKFVNGQAAGSDPAGTGQAAMSDDPGETDQAVSSAEQDGSDQTADSEAPSGGDQAALGEEEADQSARLEDLDENDQPASHENPIANLKDKVVVIIPKDWKGSVPGLIAALEASPDARDIVLVQEGEPQARGPSDEDDYIASRMKPAINQQ